MASVIVVGSIGGDVVARAPHLPAAGETVLGDSLERHPGGKGANQAAAAAAAGAPTRMVGRIGDDDAGRAQLAFLGGLGVDLSAVRVDLEAPTQTAIIVVDRSGCNSIVVVPGASGRVTAAEAAIADCGPGDVVLCQAEVPMTAVMAAFARGRERGALTLLNLAPAVTMPPGMSDLVDILVVNESEAEVVLSGDAEFSDEAALAAAALALTGHCQRAAVLTVGERGCVTAGSMGAVRLPALAVTAVDTTGAGDCFVGYLAAGLVAGDDLLGALRVATQAAALSVQRHGAGSSIPRRSELTLSGRPDL